MQDPGYQPPGQQCHSTSSLCPHLLWAAQHAWEDPRSTHPTTCGFTGKESREQFWCPLQ